MTSTRESELTWELVRSRNNMERLKYEKLPLDVIHQLTNLAERGYEEVSEEDLARLRWYGLHHDKPKQGRFMLRIKLPGGALSPSQLRTIGQLSQQFGEDSGEITTRQNIQLHAITLRQLPAIFATLGAAGLNTVGGGGDMVRAITGCPVSGLDATELFNVRPVIEAAAGFFHGHREYADLPRKLKIDISACPDQCDAPEIHCVALVGTIQDGRQGFAVRVGGGLSTSPRLSDDLGVFVPSEHAIPVLRAIIDVWKEHLPSRLSRARARLKFLLGDLGPETFRARVEDRLGYRLADGAAPVAQELSQGHGGIRPQKQPGLHYASFAVDSGLVNGERMVEIAGLAESYGGEIRLTRRQNLILTHIPEARVPAVVATMARIGFLLSNNPSRVCGVACTGQPFCNVALVDTKRELDRIVKHIEKVFGETIAPLEVNLDGCPHACAHHWVADIGLQGTTIREPGANGQQSPAYDIYLGGGLGAHAALGRPVLRRVPAAEAHLVVERLVCAYLDGRQEGERARAFFARLSDQELIAIGSGAAAWPDLTMLSLPSFLSPAV